MYNEIQAIQNINMCNDIGSQISINAETYTERRLYQLCSTSNEKIKIFYEWQNNKERYELATNTISNNFQNYSLHDKTHSRSIVSAIEKFLGEDRVNLLGIGDLWLILNAAYSHDIGMYIKNEEVLKLWREDEEFHEYIRQLANHPEMKLQKEARFYLQIHNMLNHKSPMEGMKGDDNRITNLNKDWPVEMKKNVMILTNEHFRKKHTKRSQEYMQKYQNALGIQVAENRLYKVLGDIACAHGEDFDYVMKSLWKEEDGFGEEKVHPQFVAALLRLGDLLDMDNNRFDIYSLEHFGELPQISKDHLNKHLALTHLSIDKHHIKAVEETQDYNTCKLALHWFWMIEEETKHLRENWNTFVPDNLGGCTFQSCDLKVYLNGHLYKRRQQDRFQVEQKKFMDIMIGDKLYDDQLVFVREYIQNSMDAVKVLLGEQINSGRNTIKLYQVEQINPETRSPLEIKADYLNDLAIEVFLNIVPSQDEEDRQKFRITFKDAGIGIDEEGLQVLSVVGTSWKGRKQYSDELSKMPCWLYPTGGFGVGMQSGFMFSDKVRVKTSPLKDTQGYEITLVNPRTGGNIDIITVTPGKTGTETSMDIDIDTMLQITYPRLDEKRKAELQNDQSKYANKTEILKIAAKALSGYIKKTFPNCFFPIILMYQGDTKMVSDEISGLLYRVLRQKNINFSYDTDMGCAWGFAQDEKTTETKFVVWSYKDQYYGEIVLGFSKEDDFCYRGVHVENKKEDKKIISPEIGVFLDFYQTRAEEWLLVSRSGFVSEKEYHVYELAKKMFLLYLQIMVAKYKNVLNRASFEGIGTFGHPELRAFLTGVFCFPDWSLIEELKQERKPIQAIHFLYEKNTGKIERKATTISFGELYRQVSEGEYVFWQRNGQEQCEDEIDLKNVVNGDSTVELNQKLKALLNSQTSAVVIITESEYVACLEATNRFPKYSARLFTQNSDTMIVGYMNCAKENAVSAVKVEEVLGKEIEKSDEVLPSYLEVSYQEEYAVLYVSRLPFDTSIESLCKDKNIILLPYKTLKIEKDGEGILTWERYWQSVTNSDSWKAIMAWVLRHPQNECAFIEKKAVETAYRKLYAIIYKMLEKRIK